MQSFIEEVVHEVVKKNNTISNIVFVLPSKRAGTFLRNSLSKIINETSFAPEIYLDKNHIMRIFLV